MEDTKYCPHCGKQIKSTAKKCIHCKQWVDGRENAVSEPATTNDGNSSSGVSPVVLIIATLALLVLGVLIYYLAKGDGDKHEFDEPVVEERIYNDSRDRDRSSSYESDRSSSYDSDYGSSSSSSYGSSSSKQIITCPICHGTGIDGDEECIPCSGSGKMETDTDCGACHKGCGCSMYITQVGSDMCVFCLMHDCYSYRSDHLK